jgi:protein SCO1/2
MELSEGTIACRLWPKNKLRSSKQILLVVLILALGFVSCNFNVKKEKAVVEDKLPFYNSADFDAEWIDESAAGYNKIHKIKRFKFTNQEGAVITNDSLKGKIYVANFFFTSCPNICPKMVNNLLPLQEAFADNNQIRLVSFSVMPSVDTVEKLKEYGENHKINSKKWYLLTGDKDAIYELGRKSFFAEKTLGLQKNNDEFLHTESMLLIDKSGRIRGIYNATQATDIERVTDDIKVLSKE